MRSPYVQLYTQQVSLDAIYYSIGGYTSTALTYSFANGVVNKNTTFTLGPLSLVSSAVNYVILQLDQTLFSDIGRSFRFACGLHLCSKFNIPHQYIILYPQTPLLTTATLTFPNIMTPVYGSTFTFNVRAFQNLQT
jgi:hypothetical protein